MKQRLIATAIFIAYCAVLVKVMVFKDLPVIRVGSMMFNLGGSQEGSANLIPFKTILSYLQARRGWVIAGINLIGNVILLVPIGFLFPFVFPKINWKTTLVLAAVAGLSIEGMQVLLHVGIFDIDDIILNGIGVIVGYWAFKILATNTGSVKAKTIIITAVSVTVIVVIITAAAVFYDVHIGNNHRLPEHSEAVTGKNKIDSIENSEVGIDPCNGTGGTGQILSVGNRSITVKLHNGTSSIINFTRETKIRNSTGAVSKNDLKIGDRVTIVVDGDRDGVRIAMAVFVCK